MSLKPPIPFSTRLARLLPPSLKRLARRGVRAAVLAALRGRSRPLVLDPGPLLIISPHPDDDVLGCAGLMHRHSRAGRQVFVIYLTDGDASHPGHPELGPARLAEMRRGEARRAAESLGVPDSALSFVGLPDGRLPDLPDEARARNAIAALLLRRAPATILLPLRDDGSSEHAAAHALAAEAIRSTGLASLVLEYPVWAMWRPTRLFPLLSRSRRIFRHTFVEDRETKARALAAHASQIAPTPPWTRPVLPEDFASSFSRDEEFFFGMDP